MRDLEKSRGANLLFPVVQRGDKHAWESHYERTASDLKVPIDPKQLNNLKFRGRILRLAEQIDQKHLARIRNPREGSGYAKLTEKQRAELIAGIQAIDAASKVRVLAPASVKANSIIEVTVEAEGGAGPVVGLALVDAAHRWQARPAPAAGWQVLDVPRVIGPDDKDQTRFTQGRAPGLAPGISYVNVYGLGPDVSQGRFDKVRVIYQLRAPSQPGTVPLGAVFLYGTEKAAPHGTVETLRGIAPVGGRNSASGRVKFSPVLKIEVQ